MLQFMEFILKMSTHTQRFKETAIVSKEISKFHHTLWYKTVTVSTK